jgi:hypothetical protein
MKVEVLSELPINMSPWDTGTHRELHKAGDVVDVELPTKDSHPDFTGAEIKQWEAWFENGVKKEFFRPKPGRPKTD